MEFSAYDLETTLRAGGYVTVNAPDYTAYELETMARAAWQGGGSLTILQGETLSAYDRERIARAGAKLYVDARPEH